MNPWKLTRYPDGKARVKQPEMVDRDGSAVLFADLTREERDALGYNEMVPVTPEPFTAFETALGDKGADLIYREEVIETTVDVEAFRKDVLAKIDKEKNRVRDGGFEVDGIVFDSDAGARIAYTELALELQSDPGYSTDTWKPNDTDDEVLMNAELFAKVRAAGKVHIDAVFNWRKAKRAQALAATTYEELAAVEVVYA